MVVQEQGLLDPIATVETQRPWTEPPGSRAPRLGPRTFSVGGVDSLGWSFVWYRHLYPRTNFKFNRAAAFAEWRQLLSA